MEFLPYAISWNLTTRCNLSCQHCYIDAGARNNGSEGEVSKEEAFRILDQIAEVNSGTVLILTGGEPLMHPDIYEIASYASGLGMMPVLGTNGTMLTPAVVKRLIESGVTGVGVSIDSLKEGFHDSFRGSSGSLKQSMEGLLNAKNGGLEIQVQTTASIGNIDEIPAIAEWAHGIGAMVYNLFFLVCTGRGQTMSDISPESYEKILKWSADSQNAFPGMMIRPKCAPHFKRILHQQNPDDPLLGTYIAACRAGTNYARITPDGKLTPCPYMPDSAGDLKKDSFVDIWKGAESFSRLRSPEYGGKCGLCRYRLICGGCRARAQATLDDDMAEDQWCVYEPVSQEEAITNADTDAKFGAPALEGQSDLVWTDAAKEKLLRIPVFARSIVERGVERYAVERGIEEITPEVMTVAAPPPGIISKRKGLANKPQGEIPWDEDARARVEDAPDFVRPGILKLMQKRAAERGQARINTEFLTEIRNESMMLVTRRMKKFGFSELDMKAWGTAKEKFKKSDHKKEVIDTIVGFLGNREKPNEMILEKFESYFNDDSENIGWTDEAKKRLEKTPFFVRKKAKGFIEKFAKENGYKYITESAINEAMEKLPFAKMMKP